MAQTARHVGISTGITGFDIACLGSSILAVMLSGAAAAAESAHGERADPADQFWNYMPKIGTVLAPEAWVMANSAGGILRPVLVVKRWL